jgi:hypothetical protein
VVVDAPFRISVDRPKHLIRISLAGFWDMKVVEAFVRDAEAATNGLRCAAGEHCALVDLVDFAIQSQQVFDACSAFIHNAPNKPRRLALVGGTGLARMQFKRIIDPSRMAIFGTTAEAESWLADHD